MSILFLLRLLIFLVRRRIRRVVVILGVIFGMTPVICLTVVLWRGRWCLWSLMCLCPSTSAVAVMSEVVRQILIGNLLNRSPFLSPKSVRSCVCVESQEDMSYERTPVEAPPTSLRRRMLPTPHQSSYSSIEAMPWQTEMGDQGSSWNARDRTEYCESGAVPE